MWRALLPAVAFSLGLFGATRSAPAEDKKPLPCIAYWPEARYVVGYNHIVHIYNSCTWDAVCVVRTDRNPTPQTASVPQRQEVLVTTYLGSPVAQFTPFVECQPAR